MKLNFWTISIVTIFIMITGITYGKDLPPVMRIKLEQHFTYLEVSDHISVVLTNETGKDISVDGDRSKFGKVKALVKKGKLSIWLQGSNMGDKLTVYVPARLLKQFVINGDSKVVTEEVLDNRKLDVVVNGACQLSLRSKGKINVTGTNEFEFQHSYE
ncbi:MAG TPA: DUF2807 domain-containing protein [Chitinophagaceae bacterium]|nr:DUF2807 domain-containing protein [Chitinophagaceae bacterium]HRF16669.1 DUF2807 domain-containing protein [Chitinophagaceae bacterium]